MLECFRFFLAANIVASPELQTTNAVRATTMTSCLFHIAKERSGF